MHAPIDYPRHAQLISKNFFHHVQISSWMTTKVGYRLDKTQNLMETCNL